VSSEPQPRPHLDYPTNFTEFIDRFHSEADAWAYISEPSLAWRLLLPSLRWPRRLAEQALPVSLRELPAADLSHRRPPAPKPRQLLGP